MIDWPHFLLRAVFFIIRKHTNLTNENEMTSEGEGWAEEV